MRTRVPLRPTLAEAIAVAVWVVVKSAKITCAMSAMI